MCSPLTEKVDVWENELKFDKDKGFILSGIKNGFSVIDSNVVDFAEAENHKSCFISHLNRVATENAIINEIQKGNYIITGEKPKIVSAIGCVPKPNSSDIRLIHDASRPYGKSLNSYATASPPRHLNFRDWLSPASKSRYG